MRKILSILVVPILALLLLGVALPSKTDATEFHFKSYTLDVDKSINDDLYIFADNTSIKGAVNGDLFVFAKTISIDGIVTGDAYLFGSQVDLGDKARIEGTLYLFGDRTTVGGVINTNTNIFAYTTSYRATTEKDVAVFTFDNLLKGSVGDDARIFSGRSTIESSVGGDLTVLSEKYTVNKNNIAKDIYDSKSIKAIAQSQGVDLDKDDYSKKENDFTDKVSGVFLGSVMILIAGLFLIFMTPVKTAAITEKILGTPLDFVKSFGVGLLVFLVSGFPILILLFSIIGSAVGGILFTFILFVIIFGKIWVEIAFGQEVLKLFKVKEYRPYKSFLVGRLITTVVGLIPIISDLYGFIITTTALGAMVRMKKEGFHMQSLASKKISKK